jgi:hypothetical protein
MTHEVTKVRPLGGTRLALTFAGGEVGEVDVAALTPLTGVFQPLTDPSFFSQVRVEPDLRTIVWPNGADICPDVLFAAATGLPLPNYSQGRTAA